MKKSILKKLTAIAACASIGISTLSSISFSASADYENPILPENVEDYVDINQSAFVSNVTHYYQSGGQSWSSDYCGGSSSNPTIANAGCAITSFAMILGHYGLSANPGQVNSTLGSSAYPFQWYTAASVYGLSSPTITTFSNTYAQKALAHSTICSYVRNDIPVIVGLKNSSGNTHFVVARGAAPQNAYIYIYDPSYNTDNTVLSQYTNNGYYVYEIIVY